MQFKHKLKWHTEDSDKETVTQAFTSQSPLRMEALMAAILEIPHCKPGNRRSLTSCLEQCESRTIASQSLAIASMKPFITSHVLMDQSSSVARVPRVDRPAQ